MRLTKIFILCALVLCFAKGMALRCRTSQNDGTNDRFERVMQRCRARIFNQNRNTNNGNSSEEDSILDDSSDDQSSTSDERDSDKKFINDRIGTTDASNSMRNPNPNDSRRDQKNNGGRFEQNSSSTSRPYPYNRMTNGSYETNSALNDRLSRNMTLRSGSYNRMDNSGRDNMQTNPDDHACAIQCFFDELDLTDHKGFPEKFAVAKIMKESIRESELQDFVEGAVMDCFHMIDADRNKEPCKSSQHLLNCLASKGRERCEDWGV